MLYCVMVSSGQSSWSARHNIYVNPEDGFTVWEAKNQNDLDEQIWEARSEAAQSYEPEVIGYDCDDCGESHYDEEDALDCCGSTCTVEEEDWSEFVEKNSHSEYVEYDPTNPKHARCKNWNTTVKRPEHEIAVKEHQEKQRKEKRARLQDEAAKLRVEIAKLEARWEKTILEIDNV